MYAFDQNKKNWIAQFWNESLVQRLIFINVAVFLLINLVAIIALWFDIDFLLYRYSDTYAVSKFTHWLTASSSLVETLQRPWSVISYMFLHKNFWHLVFNMVFLLFAGQLFTRFLGEKRLLSIYIFGGLSGLGLYMLAYNLIPYFHSEYGTPIMGASASVMAIFIATAAYQPNLPVALPFVGSIKLKYIALIYLIMDFVEIRNGANAGGHIAHLGGALYGFYSIYLFKKGKDIYFDLFPLLHKIKAVFSTNKGLKVNYRSKKAKPHSRSMSHSDYEYNSNKRETEKRVDEILDKISKSGYESLNKEEKDFLFRQSTKNQN